jgi:hypothetical protein
MSEQETVAVAVWKTCTAAQLENYTIRWREIVGSEVAT